MPENSIDILQKLIRCESVTPEEGGAITYIEELLKDLGFKCLRLKFSDKDTPDVENLYARFGTEAPNICFAGHTDVVPIGNPKSWKFPPFAGTIEDGIIYGRGTTDMKGGIAAFIAATIEFLKENQPKGSISLLITGDEEGPSINGTRKVLKWMEEQGEKMDFCIVGEPTSQDKLGDMIKIGRRGSFTGYLTVKGVQGHVAYPHLADNPVPKLVTLLKALDDLELDQGNEHFQPSNLEVVKIDIDNKATNVIPEEAKATFNVRFNSEYNGDTLDKKIRETLDNCDIAYELETTVGGESFYTAPGKYSDLVKNAIKEVTGLDAELSTTGGTSDARFIKNYCPVIECGVNNKTAHKVDEHIAVEDIVQLSKVYLKVLQNYY